MNSSFKEIDNSTLKKLQSVQLEILDEIDRICKKNDIQYFLVGGTLLGAVRHKGFIPWDDDLDIGMLRHDYEKFIKVCYSDLKSSYYLDCFSTNDECHFPFAKVRKNNTTFNEMSIANLDIHKGIYVDIFPLDIESNCLKKCYIKGFLIRNFIETIFCKRKICKVWDCRHPFVVSIFKCFSFKTIFKLEKLIATSYKGKKNSHLVSYFGAYSIKKEFFAYDVFFPTKLIEFSGKLYPCLNNNDKYLTSLYGDYMKLPPKEKRINHNTLFIDFDKGKSKVLSKKEDVSNN